MNIFFSIKNTPSLVPCSLLIPSFIISCYLQKQHQLVHFQSPSQPFFHRPIVPYFRHNFTNFTRYPLLETLLSDVYPLCRFFLDLVQLENIVFPSSVRLYQIWPLPCDRRLQFGVGILPSSVFPLAPD